ncbi:MAG: hypothetical protein Fues2KO_54130 [Fuerstiella sp.]
MENRTIAVRSLSECYHLVTLTARPLRGADHLVMLTILPVENDRIFAESQSPDSAPTEADDVSLSPQDRSVEALETQVRELEHELATTRQQLSASIEDLETANEELQAANEESMSVNEELQEATDDLNNLLLGTHLPTIFIDTHFHIRRFTPSATQLFHLISSDTGRLLSDIRADFDVVELFQLAELVINHLQPGECFIETTGGRHYIARLQPYRTEDNHFRGVVMTFADVTELRNSEQLAQSRLAELKTIYDSTPIGLSFVDRDLRFRSINRELALINGVPAEETIGRTIREVLPDPLGEEVVKLYRQVLKSGEPIDDIEVSGQTAATDDAHQYKVSYHPVTAEDGEILGVNSVVEDVTIQRSLKRELETSNERLKQLADHTDYVFWITQINPEKVLYVSPAFEKLWWVSAEALSRDARIWMNTIHPEDRPRVAEAYEQWVMDPERNSYDIEYRICRGVVEETRWIHDRGNAIFEADGSVVQVAGVARDITEAKRTAERIRQTEARLHAFLDNAPVMMGLVELPADDADILHVLDNRATEEFFGCGADETAGKWAEKDLRIGAETKELWVQHYRNCQRQQQPVHFLVDYDRPQKSEGNSSQSQKAWLNVTVSHLGAGEDGRERFCYVAIDDTQRIRAESNLNRSHETFARLLRDSPFGMYLVDSDFTIREVSNGSQKTFATVQPVIGRHLHEVLRILWPQPFADEAFAQFRRTMETGEPYETSETTEKRDDTHEVESYHWRIQRVDAPDGGYGVVGYYYDVTPIRRAEAALRQSEGRLRLAAELASIGVISIDYRRDEAVLDTIAARLFDLPQDEPVPRSQIHRRFHPYDREGLFREIREACSDAHSETMSLDHRIVQEDGTVKWLDVCKRVYFEQPPGDDEPIAVRSVVAVVDVTSRKEYEQVLNAARDEAEAANRARGEFLANMSHEIRTPMTAILGYADMLSDHLQDPDNRQCVETIRRNGRFLLDIINDILDLSKIDAGRMELDREPILPQTVLADVVSLMNVRAEEKSISLTADFDGSVPETIETDGKRLRQVLLNLTGNAIKFTSEGSVRIVTRFNHDTENLEFEVVDTGIGIQPEELETLFEPFTQIDSSHTRSFGGTGLGLAISRRLAQMMGGSIRAASTPGEGSTFTVSIDPGPLEGVPFVVPKPDSSSPAEDAPPLSLNCTVLIVDDRRDIRFLAQNFIEQAGGIVQTANNGQEGVQAIREAMDGGSLPDVILMDMQMPVMDGYTATRELRRLGIELPIIALTANAMAEDREKCLAAGCTDFLTKPLDRRRLIEAIAQYCSQ